MNMNNGDEGSKPISKGMPALIASVPSESNSFDKEPLHSFTSHDDGSWDADQFLQSDTVYNGSSGTESQQANIINNKRSGVLFGVIDKEKRSTMPSLSFSNASAMVFNTTVRNLQEADEKKKPGSKAAILSASCQEIMKKYRYLQETGANAPTTSEFAPRTISFEQVKKRKVRSNPRDWHVLYSNITKDECMQCLRYHRWKEPVTNAPRGTGCRVSQCAIHTECNHLLKMRLTNPCDLTRYTIEECGVHSGEDSQRMLSFHEINHGSHAAATPTTSFPIATPSSAVVLDPRYTVDMKGTTKAASAETKATDNNKFLFFPLMPTSRDEAFTEQSSDLPPVL